MNGTQRGKKTNEHAGWSNKVFVLALFFSVAYLDEINGLPFLGQLMGFPARLIRIDSGFSKVRHKARIHFCGRKTY
jgi:hypothetical protein